VIVQADRRNTLLLQTEWTAVIVQADRRNTLLEIFEGPFRESLYLECKIATFG